MSLQHGLSSAETRDENMDGSPFPEEEDHPLKDADEQSLNQSSQSSIPLVPKSCLVQNGKYLI